MENLELHRLLELAAKAAGLRIKRKENDYFIVWIDDEPMRWEPHRDDGDSRRLEAALDIDVQFNTDEDQQTTTAIAPSPERPGSGEGWCFTEGWGDDKAAAIRLAVLRAAAAIGAAMP